MSLRAFVVSCLLAGGAAGFALHGVRAQRQAVVSIERAGGSVDYSIDWSDGDYIGGGRSRWHEYFAEWFGIDCFSHATRVILLDCMDTKVLSDIGRLDRLECLYLAGPAVSSDELRFVELLTRLEEIRLLGGEIDDAALRHLRGLKKLRRLYIGGHRITDGCVVRLEPLTSLEEISLWRTCVTEEGILRLRRVLPKAKLFIQ
jgi:hypothetical protein